MFFFCNEYAIISAGDAYIMKKNTKKIIPPLIVTIIVGVFSLIWVFAGGFFPFPQKLIFLIIPIIVLFFSIRALIERIDEIRSGDEDDISKY